MTCTVHTKIRIALYCVLELMPSEMMGHLLVLSLSTATVGIASQSCVRSATQDKIPASKTIYVPEFVLFNMLYNHRAICFQALVIAIGNLKFEMQYFVVN